MSFADQYRPSKLNDLLLSNEARHAIISWIDAWLQNSEAKKALILWGQQGIGKTSTAYAIANHAGLPVVEMNASEQRNRESMKEIALMASQYHDLLEVDEKIPNRVILIDEADNIFESKNKATGGDTGGMSELLDIIKNTKNPVIITMNDYYAFKAKNNAKDILSRSLVIDLAPYKRKNEKNYKLFSSGVYKILKDIKTKEGIPVNDAQIREIINANEPDIRAMINDLYLYKSGESRGENNRDSAESIYYITSDTFRIKNYDKVLQSLYKMDEDIDFYMKWIDENIPYEYSDPEDAMNAYDLLSVADVYCGNEFSDFSLANYAMEITGGISLMAKSRNPHYVKYTFPSYILKLGKRKNNSELHSLFIFSNRMAAISHTSVATISKNLWFYNIVSRKDKKLYSFLLTILAISEKQHLNK